MKTIFLVIALLFFVSTAFAQSAKILISHPWKVDPVAVDEQIAHAGDDETAITALEKMKNQTYTFSTKKKVNHVIIENEGEGTWTLDGFSFTIKINGGERRYRITELTGARFAIRPHGSEHDIVMIPK
jgi:hypothetical protein